MHKLSLLSATACGFVCCTFCQATAKTTFLPDWQMADLEFQRDEPLCQDAVDKFGNKLYHKASGCPAPKVFDEHCAHDDRYISECYCPAHYQYNCVSPYRGDERVKKNGYASCDGLYIACCDGSCPGNTSKSNPGGCGGSTTNDCGDTCYYPYQPCCYPSPSETGCTCGSYSCSDGCGGTRTCCTACPPPPSPPSTSSSGGGGGGGGSSSSGGGSSGSGSSGSSGNNCSGSRYATLPGRAAGCGNGGSIQGKYWIVTQTSTSEECRCGSTTKSLSTQPGYACGTVHYDGYMSCDQAVSQTSCPSGTFNVGSCSCC